MMKESIKSIAPVFSSQGMVKEYTDRHYPSLLECAKSGYDKCPI
jgi:hypothetical protein